MRPLHSVRAFESPLQGVKRPRRVSGGAGLLRFAYHTTPWESMALATFRKPATFAPTMRSPGLPTSTLAS